MLIDFRDRQKEGERERDVDMREKHPSFTSHMLLDQDQNHNLGMDLADWEWNP